MITVRVLNLRHISGKLEMSSKRKEHGALEVLSLWGLYSLAILSYVPLYWIMTFLCSWLPHECCCASQSHAVQTLLNCIQNGVGATQRQALRAIAAMCSYSEAARKECAVSHGWFTIFTGLQSSDILVQSAAAATMRALFCDNGDILTIESAPNESCMLMIWCTHLA